jgi:dienelactone hydrolase
MTLVLAALLVQDLQDAVERALAEDDRTRRLALLAPLRKAPWDDLVRAVRNPRRGPSPLEPGKVHERVIQDFPVALHVPPGYAPDRTWPLLVTLHGANLDGDAAAGSRWIQAWLRCPEARDGAVILAPTTVRHTWSARPAHAAVLAAVREAQRLFRIDPDRIYLDGMSMGAGGAFRLAEHHPDRWAAIGPRCNVPDVRKKRDGSLIAMLPENLLNLPVYWVVGAKDERIPVEFARAARNAYAAAGVDVTYREIPEGGHDWGLGDDAAIFAWYLGHPRRPAPEQIAFKSLEKSFQRCAWIEILSRSENGPVVMVHQDMKGGESERRTEYRPPATVRGVRKGLEYRIETEEVRELGLWIDAAVLDPAKPVVVFWNGRKVHDAPLKRSVEVLIEQAWRRDDRGSLYGATIELKRGGE